MRRVHRVEAAGALAVGRQGGRHLDVSSGPAITSGQRGWNAQPVGRASGCGTAPPIVASRSRGTAVMLGTERSSARV